MAKLEENPPTRLELWSYRGGFIISHSEDGR